MERRYREIEIQLLLIFAIFHQSMAGRWLLVLPDRVVLQGYLQAPYAQYDFSLERIK
jgi:hypothetical protein